MHMKHYTKAKTWFIFQSWFLKERLREETLATENWILHLVIAKVSLFFFTIVTLSTWHVLKEMGIFGSARDVAC